MTTATKKRRPVPRGRALRAAKAQAKRERILALIQRWAEEHQGHPPRVADWRNVRGTGWPSYLTVIRYFGSWDEAILEAGFSPRGRGRPVEDL